MSVTSFEFAAFFALVLLLHNAVASRLRWLFLLAAGAFFYFFASPWTLFFYAGMTAANFFILRALSDQPKGRAFALGLGLNLGVLLLLKYANFILASLGMAFDALSIHIEMPRLNWAVPLGISFYVFQALAYLMDVQRGAQKAEISPGKFALFLSFFPLISSGPIERGKNLLPQIHAAPAAQAADLRLGFKRMAWGVFKKLVIADRLAIYVNQVFDHPADFQGLPILLAVIFFAFQLYADFSGYSDIVIGAARTLGYNLTENFNAPYFSSSVQGFWNSWHITLSAWLRDYIFFPLRRSLLRRKNLPAWVTQAIPPLLTMLVSGIWHGANWTFVLWGFLHGVYLLVETYTKPPLDSWLARHKGRPVAAGLVLMQTLFTFALVSFGWIFFRANSVADAFTLLRNLSALDLQPLWLAIQKGSLARLMQPFVFDGGLTQYDVIFSLALIFLLLVLESVHARVNLFSALDKLPAPARWAFYLVSIFAIVLLAADNSNANFIYFKF